MGDFHNPNVRRYEYDLDKANEILDGMGWTDTDGNGIREDSEGNEIEFSMVTNSGNSVRETVGMLVHQGMEKIGIKVDYRLIEFRDLVFQLTRSYDWEAMIIGFTGGSDPHSGITFWHSGESLHLWHPNQPQPETEWEAEIDELYIMASQEMDREQARGLLPPRPGGRRRERARHLYDALRKAERSTKHLRQPNTHAVCSLGHPLPVPHDPIARRLKSGTAENSLA